MKVAQPLREGKCCLDRRDSAKPETVITQQTNNGGCFEDLSNLSYVLTVIERLHTIVAMADFDINAALKAYLDDPRSIITAEADAAPVSYTHLTLPTKRIV